MADDGIKISIGAGSTGGGKRLAESPSSSFAADRFTQRNTTAFAAPGTGARSEINAQRELVSSQRALTAEIKQLRTALRATLPNSAERASLKGRVDQLLAQQKLNLAGAFNTSAIGRETVDKTGSEAVAGMPGAAQRGIDIGQRLAIAGRSLFGIASQTFAGNPMGAFRQAVGGVNAFNAGRFAGGGAAEGAAAEGVATDLAGGAAGAGAEAASGSILSPVLAAGALAALGLGAYEVAKHPKIAAGLVESPLAIYDARQYGREEAERQTGAYRYAREFGEAGGPLSSFTRGSRFSALGMDAQQALDITGGMRETAGSQNISEGQAYRATRAGTFVGLSNQDITQVGGGMGKLDVDPERAIDIVARGVERGNQRGLQGEIGRATLQFLQQQSRLGAVNETKAAETVTGVAALLGASGIAAFKGEGAITTGVAGMAAANQPGDLLGIQSTGQAYTTVGAARLLQSINADPRYRRMSTLDRAAMADRILTQNFTGPNAGMYLKSVIAPEIEQAKSQGLYGLESLEKQFGFPVGDQSDRLVTGSLLTAAESGDVSAYLKLKSQLEANGPGQIPAATKAMAEHGMARSATGASALGTFAGVENVEASMLRRLAIAPSTDRNVASLLNKFAGVISPTSAIMPTSSAAMPGDSPWGTAFAGGPAGTFYGAPPLLAGPATATAPGGDSARDSTLQAVGSEIVVAINTLITTIASAYPPANFSAPAAPPAAPLSTTAHGPTGPTASTPKSRRH